MSPHVLNPFLKVGDAYSYHRHRPHFHDVPFGLIKELLQEKLEKALDVACGTGHSTMALEILADDVVGLDQSSEMIKVAKESFSNIKFVEGKAEDLPFEASSFDLINISMGLHWVDHHSFFREVTRTLRPGGFFVIDNFGFEGIISEHQINQDDHYQFFKDFLPSADKNKSYGEKGLLHVNSLLFKEEGKYKKNVRMNRESFMKLLQTTSNFLILSDDRKKDALVEMEQVYGKIFEENFLDLGFGGEFKIYQKQA